MAVAIFLTASPSFPLLNDRRRAIAWPVLLGLYQLDSSAEERQRLADAMRETYNCVCKQVDAEELENEEESTHFRRQVRSGSGDARADAWRVQCRSCRLLLPSLCAAQCEIISLDVMRADKDYWREWPNGAVPTEAIVRLLKAYCFLNRYPGYSQGMSGVLFVAVAREAAAAASAGSKRQLRQASSSSLILHLPQIWPSRCWPSSRTRPLHSTCS